MFPTGPYFWFSILIAAAVVGLKIAYDRGSRPTILFWSAITIVTAGVGSYLYMTIISDFIAAVSSFPR